MAALSARLAFLAFLTAAACAVAIFPAFAAEAGEPRKVGRNVAENVCVRCHDIREDLRSLPLRQAGVPPAFLTVAADPAMNSARLIKFLTLPHGAMDNVFLTRRETEDVAGYIMSLRRK